jgi:hypothetical protein
MNRFFVAAVAVAAISTPVFAEGMNNAIGNTVRVTSGENTWDTWFLADGSFTDSRGVAGTWTFTTELCLSVQTEEGPQSNCGPWDETLALGGTWMATGWSAEGTEIKVEIVAAP